MNTAERYMQHLESITGRAEDSIHKVDSSDPNLPHVYVFKYHDWPEPGFLTGFSFGLSAARHADWGQDRPEAMISVKSSDDAWLFAAALMVEGLRGQCPFSHGNMINFQGAISEGSELDAFLVSAPPFLSKEQQSVQLGDFTCTLVGMYPIYSAEMSLCTELGLEPFQQLPGWDPFNVHRKPMTAR